MAKQVKVLKAVREGDVYSLSWYVPDKVLWGKVLEKVKMIPGRLPSKDAKGKFIWKCPVNPRTTQLVQSIGFKITEKVVKKKPEEKVKPVIDEGYKKEVLRDVDPRLRDYQLDGVKFWQYHNFNALNLDDMGTGKTCMSLSAVRTSGIRPVLICCPASLKLNFEKECKMWLNPEDNDKVHVVHGMLNMWYKDAQIVIINYDLLWKHLEYILKAFRPKLIIADEVHVLSGKESYVSLMHPDYKVRPNQFVKKVLGRNTVFNPPPKRVRAMEYLIEGLSEDMVKRTFIDWNGINHFMPMTGTPITKNAGNIFNVLHWLNSKQFKDREKFEDFFCLRESGFNKGELKIKGAKNMDVLHKIVFEKYAIRRTKKEVLKELPDTTKIVVPLELPDKYRKLYDQIAEDFDEFIQEKQEAEEEVSEKEQRKRFKLLMDTAMEGKLELCYEFIDNIVNNSDEKVLILSYNTKIVKAIKERYGDRAVEHYGGTSNADREKAVEAFQNDPKIQVFSGQTQSSTVGITLTAGHIVIFLQVGWWAHLVQQGIDRLNRMGQKSEKVLAYFLQAEDTIEKYLLGKIDKDQAMIEAIVDGNDVEEEDTLTYLWDIYKKRLEKR